MHSFLYMGTSGEVEEESQLIQKESYTENIGFLYMLWTDKDKKAISSSLVSEVGQKNPLEVSNTF